MFTICLMFASYLGLPKTIYLFSTEKYFEWYVYISVWMYFWNNKDFNTYILFMNPYM